MEEREPPTPGFPLVKDHSEKLIAHFAVLEIYWATLFACNEDVNEDNFQKCSPTSN